MGIGRRLTSMYLRKSRNSSGRIYLSIVKAYRNEQGKSRQKTIMKIGYLEDMEKIYDDPIAHFTQVAKEMTEQDHPETVTIDRRERWDDSDNDKCIGYFPFTKIFQEMGIYDFIRSKYRNLNIKYSLIDSLELMTFGRILMPCSKKSTFERRDELFNTKYMKLTLDSMYDSLDYFCRYKDEIQKIIWKNTKELYRRDASTSFYDCTNYYFEVKDGDEDQYDEDGRLVSKGLRKRGPEKNKRPDPIVEMGLLMDGSGLPMAYDVFPGSDSEKLSLRPMIKRTKAAFGINRTIVVADRGLNTSDNIYFLAGRNDRNPGEESPFDGYVIGQSIRMADRKFKEWAISPDGFITEWADDAGNTYSLDEYNEHLHKDPSFRDEVFPFIHKSRIEQKTIRIKAKDGKRRIPVDITQKQMVYYSQKYAVKQRNDREKALEKARNLIANPGKYTRATSYGAAAYVKNIRFNKSTGEIANASELSIDEDLIREEEKYDGFYSIVTSELEFSDKKIRDVYRGLARIEDTFKVTKSSLNARPAFVWTPEHIQGHFLICFLALVVMRLLERKLGDRYSVDRIIEALKNYRCLQISTNYYRVSHKKPLVDEIGKAFGIDMGFVNITRRDMKKILQPKGPGKDFTT